MRRGTSGWIVGTLGVGLTASIVLAQQLPNSGGSPRGGAGSSSTSTESVSPFGASGTRGARYLLRNGLDYLQYQQYDRALKFLRDAEAQRKTLSTTELQELKRGIEAAQAGLRAPADTSNRYALSERPRPRNGFAPARPEAEAETENETRTIAARVTSTSRTGRDDAGVRARRGAVASRHDSGRTAGEDAPGEPIRLTSAESDSGAPAPVSTPASDVDSAPETIANPGPRVDPQSAKSEITALAAPGLPNLTAVPSSSDPVGGAQLPAPAPAPALGATPEPTGPQPTADLEPMRIETPSAARIQDPYDTNPPAAAPATSSLDTTAMTPDGPAQGAPRAPDPTPPPTGPATVAPTPAGDAPTTILLETPDSATNPATPAPASTAAPASEPASSSALDNLPTLPPASDAAAAPTSTPTPTPAPAPPSGGLVPAAMMEAAAPETKAAPPAGGNPPATAPAAAPATAPAVPTTSSSAAATDTEMPPLPSLGAEATKPVETAGPPHRESEKPAPEPESTPAALSPDPAAAPAGPGTDELPPLPGDLGRNASSSAAVAGAAAGAVAGAAAESGAMAPAVEQPAPAVTRPAPEPGPAPVPAAEPAATPAQSAGQGDSTPAVPTDEPLPPLPDDSADRSRAAAAPASPPDAASALSIQPSPAVPADAAPGPAASAGDVSLGASAAPAPVGTSTPAEETPIAVPQPDAASGATAPAMAPEPSPATGPVQGAAARSAEDSVFLPMRSTAAVQYTPEQARRVAELVARQEKEDELRSQMRAQPRPEGPTSRETSSSNLQTQTQYDISRAPSPAEARPIKAIPVPEDWVPLAARSWTPQRKYWAAAATCHLPLYFQDPVLERYGHPVEQFVGPMGRYLSYPVDDPKQSTQRNQIIQPFFSWGLFALQIAAWPYNAIMDPPWEAQYDLGYYRPGDMVPIDVYWLPLHGYGPPLRGNSY